MIEQIRRGIEQFSRTTSLDITLIGPDDMLHQQGRHLIATRFQSHRTRPACDRGFGAACVAHCRVACNDRLAADPRASTTHCWKGIREIATPIRWRDQHIATLYAGTWRSQQAPPEAMALGQEWIYTWHELPLWSDRYQAQWGPLLKLFASGLAEELAPIIFNTAKSTDMQTRIDSWVQLHFSREVTLNDLAEFLGRSASRTSALVRSLYGQPFALVLRSKRLKVAAHYLQTTTKRIRSIAHSAGFNDPAYFSRIFRQKYGVSPKQWRQRYDHQDDA